MSMFSHPFMVYALLGGTGIAAACGAVGFFLVLRAQVFTGDALVPRGLHRRAGRPRLRHRPARRPVHRDDRRWRCCSARSANAARADDVVIGNVFAWILGLGVFFLTLYTTNHSGSGTGNGDRQRPVRLDPGAVRRPSHTALWIGAGSGRRAGGHRPAAAVRLARPGRGRRARRARQGARLRLPGPGRRGHAPRRRKPSARCCCSAWSPHRPAPHYCSPTTPTTPWHCPPHWQ